jgi:DNA-binding FadR family transcriptional regulator
LSDQYACQYEGYIPDSLVQSLVFSLFFGDPDLEHLHEAREIPEVATARLAVERASDREIEEMEELLMKAERLVADGIVPFELGWAFHEAVCIASHNEVLYRLHKVVGFIVMSAHQQLLRENPSYPWDYDVRAHRRIWKSIRDRRKQAAGEAMRQHLRKAYRILEGKSG